VVYPRPSGRPITSRAARLGHFRLDGANEQDARCLDILWRSWVHVIQLLGHLALPRIEYMPIEEYRADSAFVGFKGGRALRLIVRSVRRLLHGMELMARHIEDVVCILRWSLG
jgi:hypothetical protein